MSLLSRMLMLFSTPNPLRALPRDDLIMGGMFKSSTEIDSPIGRRINDMACLMEGSARARAEADALCRPLCERRQHRRREPARQ